MVFVPEVGMVWEMRWRGVMGRVCVIVLLASEVVVVYTYGGTHCGTKRRQEVGL
jgi:hypothetical protein